ncbi:hypothetical protein GCM10023116_15840 [Kistimonas scapharcae]|uniref:Lipoprotein n=1 Tax=Kistimonas scapharcae TaxID=1036133 RepID=A0ABP8V2L4_9GAMM
MSAVLYGKGIIGGAIALLLTGCMTNFMEKPYPYDYEKSSALNVLTASGIVADSAPQVDDTPQWYIESLKRRAAKEGKQIESPSEVATSGTGVSGDTSLNVVGGSLFATGTATALPGFSSMGSAAFFMLPSLLDTKVWPYQYSSWVIWMPVDGKTPEQAQAEVTGVFEDLLVKKFPKHEIYAPQGTLLKHEHIVVDAFMKLRKKGSLPDNIAYISIQKPAIGKLPEWLGEGDAYVWGVRPHKQTIPPSGEGYLQMSVSGCTFNVEREEGYFDYIVPNSNLDEVRKCYLDLTTELPENYYFYASPRKSFVQYFKNERETSYSTFGNHPFHRSKMIFNDTTGGRYPLIMNQGRAFFFIEPTKDVQQARTGMDLLLSKERLAEVKKVRAAGKYTTVVSTDLKCPPFTDPK